jgi:hypothetical protein
MRGIGRVNEKSGSGVCRDCLNNRLLQGVASDENVGLCLRCGRSSSEILRIGELSGLLRNVANCYVEEETPCAGIAGSDSIGVLIQEDWDVFADWTSEDQVSLDELVSTILMHSVPYDEQVLEPDYRYGSFVRQDELLVEYWEEGLEEFLESGLDILITAKGGGADTEPLKTAFEDYSESVPQRTGFFRARTITDRRRIEPFEPRELGAPPAEVVKSGRANRQGEPVLYAANTEKIAIAEVRPWRGAAVAVARMESSRELRLVNLVDSPGFENPFTDELILWKTALQSLFSYLSEELSLPVIPGAEDTEYRVSQQLCELVKDAGYDGIKYMSSTNINGYNVALFDTDSLELESVQYYRVEAARFERSTISDVGPFYDERLFEDLR